MFYLPEMRPYSGNISAGVIKWMLDELINSLNIHRALNSWIRNTLLCVECLCVRIDSYAIVHYFEQIHSSCHATDFYWIRIRSGRKVCGKLKCK